MSDDEDAEYHRELEQARANDSRRTREMSRAVPVISDAQTRPCAICGTEAPRWRVDPLQPRLVCVPCFDKQDAIAADRRADDVAEAGRIIGEAKERGQLSDSGAAWLVRNGMRDAVDALKKRFQAAKDGVPAKRRRESY